MKLANIFCCLIAIQIIAVMVPYPRTSEALAGAIKSAPEEESRILEWFVLQQVDTGLVCSQDGGPHPNVCFTYDQALSVFVFGLEGEWERASRILDFFLQEVKKQRAEGTGFRGFADSYLADGSVDARNRAAGPNAWLGMATNYFCSKNPEGALRDKYLRLSKTLAEWLWSLSSENGGIRGGFDELGNTFSWISTEHNVDCYAFFKQLGKLTGKKAYKKHAQQIARFMEEHLWYEPEGRFFNGLNDANFATDVSAWTVCAFGRKYEDGLDFALRRARCKKYYLKTKTMVDGFDFGGPYTDSHYPDLDSVWFEGTAQMVIAFRKVGRHEEADYFFQSLTRCLTPSSKHDGTLGLPYASNPGTPAGGGWTMFDDRLCVSSSAWYLFAARNFNPFVGH